MRAPRQACVTVFEHINYGGAKKVICGDVELSQINWGKKISSVKVPKGVQVEFFSEKSYKGRNIVFLKDNSNFVPIGWNDVPVSAKVKNNDKTNKPLELSIPSLPAGIYKITAVHSGKCLDVSGASKNAGTQIIQWDCHNGGNQKWILSYNGNNAILTAQHSNFAASINKSSKLNGAELVQFPNKNQPNQRLQIKKNSGVYTIVSTFSGKCIDVYGGGKQNGAKIIQVIIYI